MVSGSGRKKIAEAPKNLGGRPRSIALSPLGETIDKLASHRGLTREELANEAGVSRSGLQSLLSGRTKPKLITAVRIAKALDIPVEMLVG